MQKWLVKFATIDIENYWYYIYNLSIKNYYYNKIRSYTMDNNKGMNKLQEALIIVSEKLNANIYVNAIKDGMLAYLPFTFIASIFLIIAFFPIPGYAEFITKVTGLEQGIWLGKLTLVADASLGIGGLLVLLSISRNLADKMEIDGMQVQLTALVAFMVLVPLGYNDSGAFIASTYFAAQSIFISIVIAIFTAVLYRTINNKGIKIKMPESVPPAVAKPFESIIPSLIVVATFWIIRLLFDGLVGQDVFAAFNTVVGIPIQAVGGSLIGVIIAFTFAQLLWFFGIHGASIVTGVMTPVLQVLQDQNRLASEAGELATNIINQSFWDNFASIGVVGSIIAIILIAKSKQYRQMKKIAGVPYIFNVGEPTLFGVPLMMNPTYFIPLVFSNVASIVISYAAFAIGIVPIPTGLVQLPWTTPLVISGYFVTGSFAGALLQVVCLVAVTLIWLPFVKIADAEILKEENDAELKQS